MNAFFLSKQIKRVLAGTLRINKGDSDILVEVADELEVINSNRRNELVNLFCGHGLDNKKHGCGEANPIHEMFRCYFCLTFYCEGCSKRHFGSRSKHNKKSHPQHLKINLEAAP